MMRNTESTYKTDLLVSSINFSSKSVVIFMDRGFSSLSSFKMVEGETAVMCEGSLIIALTDVCTGCWDHKCQSVKRL